MSKIKAKILKDGRIVLSGIYYRDLENAVTRESLYGYNNDEAALRKRWDETKATCKQYLSEGNKSMARLCYGNYLRNVAYYKRCRTVNKQLQEAINKAKADTFGPKRPPTKTEKLVSRLEDLSFGLHCKAVLEEYKSERKKQETPLSRELREKQAKVKSYIHKLKPCI